MPKKWRPKKLGWFGAGVFIFMLSAVPGGVIASNGGPLFLSCGVSLAVFLTLLLSAFLQNKKVKKMAEKRKEETICTFARQLNCREVDTWIIRAVYEELLVYFGYPPHLEDSFDKIDPEDVDDMGIAISERIGRPLNESEKNPYFGKVKTVRDMIFFFTAQPLKERPDTTAPSSP